MNIKEYLESILEREYALQSMKERLAFLKSMAEGGAAPRIDDKPRGPKPIGSSLENFICKAMDLEKEIIEKEEELEKEKHMIFLATRKMPSVEYGSIIIFRYLMGYSWKKVAECMEYSTGWVYQNRNRAMEELKSKLEVVA